MYDNDGKRVYYPYDPPPIHDGVRINSPHYLCKMTIPPNSTAKRYTLVISQYEKSKTIHYTLRVYSSCKFKIGEIVNNCKHRQKIVGEWKGITAGGCANHSTAINNPCFRCELKQEGKLIIDLKASKDYQIGFDVVCTNSTAAGPSTFYKKSTGAYRYKVQAYMYCLLHSPFYLEVLLYALLYFTDLDLWFLRFLMYLLEFTI